MFAMDLSLIKQEHQPEKLPQRNVHGAWLEEIKKPSVFIPIRLGDMKLYHSDKGFRVYDKNGNKSKIENVFLDPVIRNITRHELSMLLQTGYLVMDRNTNGDFSLKATVRTVGAGPLFGKIMYWATKSVCYGVLIAGAGAIVVFGGGGVSGTSNSSGPSAGEIADTGVQTVGQAGLVYVALDSTVTQVGGEAIFSPVVANGSMAAAGAVGAMIVKAGGAPVCAEAAGAALTTGTSGTGIVAGIEAISITVGVLCGMTPTP